MRDASIQIGEHHIVWLLWFVMRYGSESDAAEPAWTYDNVGVQIRLVTKPCGEDRHIGAFGRRWTLDVMQTNDGLHLQNLSSPACFWRDLSVLRLTDSNPVPFHTRPVSHARWMAQAA